MTAADRAAEAFLERQRDERRRGELFRKGVVTHVDTTTIPWLVTIAGRQMPYHDTTINVGDVVQYHDRQNAFAWARRDGFQEDGEATGSNINLAGSEWIQATAGPTTYDYDQGASGVDSLLLKPLNRLDPIFGSASWTGGAPFYYYNSIAAPGEVDFINTGITGDDLTVFGSGWDGVPIPALSNAEDQYVNIGGSYMSLRLHDINIGLADLPGAHAHLIEPKDGVISNSSRAGWQIIQEIDSFVTKQPATTLTTLQAGVPTDWPVPIFAPGEDWLLVFVAHIEGVLGAAPTTVNFEKKDGMGKSIRLASGESIPASLNFTGRAMFLGQRSLEVGNYGPVVTLASGPDRRAAFSSYRVVYRDKDDP